MFDASFRSALREIDELIPGSSWDIQAAQFEGSTGFLSAFHVDTLAMSSAAAAALAGGYTTVNAERVRATMVGNVLLDGQPVPKWADLSGYYNTSNQRFIQFHCNFEHHAAGVINRLGCEPVREAVQEAVPDWDPIELETALIDDGMIAAYLRTPQEWEQHPHATATQHLPLISVSQIGDGAPRDHVVPRVLDCSRVLAGPIAGQVLATQGADVLRVGSPNLPAVDICVMLSGAGKRNAALDLKVATDHAQFAELVAQADVWIDAYRPGAFEGHGFGLESVAPGSVVVQLCAFDNIGPWAGRRGFDSIVQSTTGIVEAGRLAAGRDQPTPLPVQALDYATGFLAAAAASKVRAHQAEVGGTWLVEVSLLRTRNWLVGLGGPNSFSPEAPMANPEALVTMDSPFGQLTIPAPMSGSYANSPQPLGTAQPHFLDR